MQNLEEILLRKNRILLDKYKDDVKATGSIDVEMSYISTEEMIDLEGFKLVNRTCIGRSSHLFIPHELMRVCFYQNNDDEFLAFEVRYSGDDKHEKERLTYLITTNSQEYVDRCLEPDYKYPKITWD